MSAAIVAHYSFNEGSGGTLYDDSGNGNNGTISGAQWTAGINGTALSFDGVNDVVTIPNSPSIAVNSYEFSIEAWVKPNSITDTRMIAGAFYGDGYYLRLAGNAIGFESVGSISSPGVVPVNTWSHIVGSFDGTYATIYLNDQIVARNQVVSPGPAPVSSTYPLAIGDFISGGMPFSGVIDEITIYNNQWTPVPEPAQTATVTVVLLAGLALQKLRKSKRISP